MESGEDALLAWGPKTLPLANKVLEANDIKGPTASPSRLAASFSITLVNAIAHIKH